MQAQTITFERVFDIQQRQTKQGRFTEFSFVADGRPHYSVSVNGWPAIDVGTTITAVLHHPDNWQTLFGWVNHASGEVVGPSYAQDFLSSIISLCILYAPAHLIVERGLSPLTQLQFGSAILSCLLIIGLAVGLLLQGVRNRGAVQLLNTLAERIRINFSAGNEN